MQIPGNAQEPVKMQESDKMKKSDKMQEQKKKSTTLNRIGKVDKRFVSACGQQAYFRLSGTGGTFAEIFTGTELFCGNRK